jgi:hypothetical protein
MNPLLRIAQRIAASPVVKITLVSSEDNDGEIEQSWTLQSREGTIETTTLSSFDEPPDTCDHANELMSIGDIQLSVLDLISAVIASSYPVTTDGESGTLDQAWVDEMQLAGFL